MELSKVKAMKVVELKNELDNRGLAKSGTKAVLVDRLFKVPYWVWIHGLA